MKEFRDIFSLVGNTPLVKLSRISKGLPARILAKLEFFNPGGSVKDRIALSMINAAEEKGEINSAKITIIEPTSGNTGIGLGWVCAQRGYKLVIVMPENMSQERRRLLDLLGAEIILTKADLGMKGAIDKANEILKNTPDAFMPGQFNNPANPYVHKITTAKEIWEDTEGKVDIVVAGVGTGGTITGIAEAIKPKKKDFKAIAVEPVNSDVLSGGKAGPHKIEGIGSGFIPENFNTDLVDEIIKVSDSEADSYTKMIAEKEGLLAGISSGAALFAAEKVAKRQENKEKLIVVIFPDGSERYISSDLLKL